MFTKLYGFRNVVSSLTHYAATAGMVAGSYLLGQPWTIGVGTALIGGLTALSLKLNKSVAENSLEEHEESHKHSPRLGEIAKELYKASGLNAESVPLYDFRTKQDKNDQDESIGKTVLKELFNTMADLPNAAALNIGKPVIMISEPLLELLNDEEEKAVLAHEFTHAVAKHTYATLPQRTITAIAKVSNSLTRLAAAFSSGVAEFLGSAVSGTLVGLSFQKMHGKGYLLDGKKEDLSFRELSERKKVENVQKVLAQGTMVSSLSYFNPLYFKIYAATKSLSIAGELLTKSYTRSNEFQADKGAVTLGANPLALVTALRKINAVMQRSKQEAWGDGNMPQPGMLSSFWKRLNATHPPVEDRIQRLCDIARKNGFSKDDIQKAKAAPLDIPETVKIPYDTLRAMAASM